MKPFLIDVAVLLIFFCRDEQFQRVFEQVKKARPSKLFLYQDGPRPSVTSDVDGIMRCRKIAEGIDWECEVHKYYQESNVGCDPSEYISQRWAFDNVDRCIVLEDDDVPCQSFFLFCAELLEKYKDDERINMICGMNQLGIVDSPYDYIFSDIGCIWGWASWRRVIDTWDPEYRFWDDANAIKLLINKRNGTLGDNRYLVDFCRKHRNTGRAHYESINLVAAELHGRVNIVAAKNMISNIGIGSESTHSADSVKKLPRAVRKVFNSTTYDIQTPLKHPPYVIRDAAFDRAVFKMLAIDCPLSRLLRNMELFLLSLRYKGLSKTMQKVIGILKEHT